MPLRLPLGRNSTRSIDERSTSALMAESFAADHCLCLCGAFACSPRRRRLNGQSRFRAVCTENPSAFDRLKESPNQSAMLVLLCFALAVLASPFKSRSRLEAENAALRHQLIGLRCWD
jgi:hypothetical protein